MSKSRFSIVERVAIKYRQFQFRNKTSSPYISGDAFRSLCEIVIDSESDLDLVDKRRFDNSNVFCRSDILPHLFARVQGNGVIRNLICGNSDYDFNYVPKDLLTVTQRAFLQNSSISDGKYIFTLPIGIENLRYGMNGLPRNLVSSIPWQNRRSRVLVGPFSPTHPERASLNQAAEKSEACEIPEESNWTFSDYSKLVNQYRFVAVPRGNGLDTHRFWEALYRGAIPVVKKSNWSESLEIYGIPFIEVDDWSPDELDQVPYRYKENGFDPKEIPSLWIEYWREFLAN